jgi:ABC-2 type transport system ATP-binding protein
LVLDEPTVGVDPQSRNAILESVLELKQQGVAIVYTTHYMEEAERLCDRVGIIDEGRLVAEGTRRELTASVGQTDRLRMTATGDLVAFAARCRLLDGVQSADIVESGIEVLANDGRRLLARVVDAAESAGALVDSVEVIEPDLEAVFLHLTGKALRDE